MALNGSLLRPGDPKYEQIQRSFANGWEDQTKSYAIKAIYSLGSYGFTGERSPQLAFYGGRRACYIGDRGKPLQRCDLDTCDVCGFLRRSFQPSYRYGDGTMGGPDVFTTTATSSEADDGVMNHHIRSHAHVIVACATTRAPSAALSTAPVTIGLVVYTRAGWTPTPKRPGHNVSAYPNLSQFPTQRDTTKQQKETPSQRQQQEESSPGKQRQRIDASNSAEPLADAIVAEKPNVRWDDVAGLEVAKKELQQTLIFPERFPQLFDAQRKPPRAILLYGPPGTGKSHLAAAVATEVDHVLFRISSGDIMSKWLGESEKLVRQLFEMARQKKPAIIFIDEIDALCANRDGQGPGGGGSNNEHTARIKTELLVQMESVGNKNDGVVVLAATNLPWALDPAARRRFQKRIYISMPDEGARKQLFQIHSGDRGRLLADQELFRELVRRTDGFSGSDIANFVQEALRAPLDKVSAATHFKKVNSNGSQLYTPCGPYESGAIEMTWDKVPKNKLKEQPVTAADFLQILNHGNVKASVGVGELGKYQDWTEAYGMEGSK